MIIEENSNAFQTSDHRKNLKREMIAIKTGLRCLYRGTSGVIGISRYTSRQRGGTILKLPQASSAPMEAAVAWFVWQDAISHEPDR